MFQNVIELYSGKNKINALQIWTFRNLQSCLQFSELTSNYDLIQNLKQIHFK